MEWRRGRLYPAEVLFSVCGVCGVNSVDGGAFRVYVWLAVCVRAVCVLCACCVCACCVCMLCGVLCGVLCVRVVCGVRCLPAMHF